MVERTLWSSLPLKIKAIDQIKQNYNYWFINFQILFYRLLLLNTIADPVIAYKSKQFNRPMPSHSKVTLPLPLPPLTTACLHYLLLPFTTPHLHFPFPLSLLHSSTTTPLFHHYAPPQPLLSFITTHFHNPSSL